MKGCIFVSLRYLDTDKKLAENVSPNQIKIQIGLLLLVRHDTRDDTSQPWISTVLVLRTAHRIWKEIKQQPSMLPGPAVPGCCLVSFHFLWAILSMSTVGRLKPLLVRSSFHWEMRVTVESEDKKTFHFLPLEKDLHCQRHAS